MQTVASQRKMPSTKVLQLNEIYRTVSRLVKLELPFQSYFRETQLRFSTPQITKKLVQNSFQKSTDALFRADSQTNREICTARQVLSQNSKVLILQLSWKFSRKMQVIL